MFNDRSTGKRLGGVDHVDRLLWERNLETVFGEGPVQRGDHDRSKFATNGLRRIVPVVDVDID